MNVTEFPKPQEEDKQPTHEELVQLYDAATSTLVKLQVPFVLLAPTGQAMGVMVSSNMAPEFRALMIMNAFLNINKQADSTSEVVVETGEPN
jgi:hypothetical protein